MLVKKRSGTASLRQARQLDYTFQFSTDIKRISMAHNVITGALSPISEAIRSLSLDLIGAIKGQRVEEECRYFRNHVYLWNICLEVKFFQIGPSLQLYCTIDGNYINPYIPGRFRSFWLSIFNLDIRTTKHLTHDRYGSPWPTV